MFLSRGKKEYFSVQGSQSIFSFLSASNSLSYFLFCAFFADSPTVFFSLFFSSSTPKKNPQVFCFFLSPNFVHWTFESERRLCRDDGQVVVPVVVDQVGHRLERPVFRPYLEKNKNEKNALYYSTN